MTRGSVGSLLNRVAEYGAVGHVAGPEPLPSREVGSRAMGHVAAREPSRVGRRDPEP
jgi:hypothetical protein